MKYMIFANYLRLFIGIFKATTCTFHLIWIEWIELVTKKSNFLQFLGVQPPPLTGVMLEVFSREVAAFKNIFGSAYDIVQQHFFHNILQGISRNINYLLKQQNA